LKNNACEALSFETIACEMPTVSSFLKKGQGLCFFCGNVLFFLKHCGNVLLGTMHRVQIVMTRRIHNVSVKQAFGFIYTL
jgi:hypothetical protein